ncbi:N-acetylmuramidase domain-containing protein [Mongoliitalea daihaiensis]|uniref:N-acetylmuramidase domain-containing protein n=1 Tax=Mongoliitalea daihaiensis TaxID=2782006 RepID=UPI001F2DD291|nr:N-acetylmuramidase family protein [Mongoliitalea daihaiensis]UJP64191.1 N-acetylmuramidase family protein [Mongoliitalea daihaiensis]
MQTLRLNSRGDSVVFLQELLNKVGYNLPGTSFFGTLTDTAVKDFQRKSGLVADGIVGVKTWTRLIQQSDFAKPEFSDKFLSEQDLIDFAAEYGLELALVKAVNEVESRGKGFLIDGRTKILFEGHEFWRQLKAIGLQPESLSNESNKDILYPRWVRTFYSNGPGEYRRLERAQQLIPSNPAVSTAALSSASWGSFQIMGYHAKPLGYPSVEAFVDRMQTHEREHLAAFGKFIVVNRLLNHLKNKDWEKFARGYNGPGYKQNKYDEKLARAYKKYSEQ